MGSNRKGSEMTTATDRQALIAKWRAMAKDHRRNADVFGDGPTLDVLVHKIVVSHQFSAATLEACANDLEALSSSASSETQEERQESPHDALLNPVNQVYFRAGLIACREYMARFVEAQDPTIAQSIRANWWPSLGPDLGPPRLLDFAELTDGEYGTPSFRTKTVEEVSPTLEALPVALGFLATRPPAQSSPVPHEVEPEMVPCMDCRLLVKVGESCPNCGLGE